MPHSIAPLALLSCDEIVRAISVSPNGDTLVWAGDSGQVHCISLPSTDSDSFDIGEAVADLAALEGGSVIVGTFVGDLQRRSATGDLQWNAPLSGGSELMILNESRDTIGIIDGAHDFHLIDVNGTVRGVFTEGELTHAAMTSGADRAAVADDEGRITMLDDAASPTSVVSPRCGDSVRITAMTFRPDGTLVICSEAIGLTDSGVPQIAIECIAPDGLRINQLEVDSCATVLESSASGIVAGFANGKVINFEIGEDDGSIWTELQYAIGTVRPCGNHLLVASWFHLRRFDEPFEETWKVEHTGIVDRIAGDRDCRIIALAGENRNDWTRINRIDIYDVKSEPFEINEDDIDTIMPEGDDVLGGYSSENIHLDDDLIGLEEAEESTSDDGDLEDLLTEEEAALWRSQQRGYRELTDPIEMSPTDSKASELELSAASEREGSTPGDRGVSKVRSREESELFQLLGEEIVISESPDSTEESFDLLTDIDDDSTTGFEAPIANAGNDKAIDPSDDGTAIVTLDGTKSRSLDDTISNWLWRDATGVTIGDGPQLRVRLPSGVHRFTLTVSNSNGTTASDAIHITVTGDVASEDEDVSLLD
jgi:hypothetical protein